MEILIICMLVLMLCVCAVTAAVLTLALARAARGESAAAMPEESGRGTREERLFAEGVNSILSYDLRAAAGKEDGE